MRYVMLVYVALILSLTRGELRSWLAGLAAFGLAVFFFVRLIERRDARR